MYTLHIVVCVCACMCVPRYTSMLYVCNARQGSSLFGPLECFSFCFLGIPLIICRGGSSLAVPDLGLTLSTKASLQYYYCSGSFIPAYKQPLSPSSTPALVSLSSHSVVAHPYSLQPAICSRLALTRPSSLSCSLY